MTAWAAVEAPKCKGWSLCQSLEKVHGGEEPGKVKKESKRILPTDCWMDINAHPKQDPPSPRTLEGTTPRATGSLQNLESAEETETY